jgi:hypothetical protein
MCGLPGNETIIEQLTNPGVKCKFRTNVKLNAMKHCSVQLPSFMKSEFCINSVCFLFPVLTDR